MVSSLKNKQVLLFFLICSFFNSTIIKAQDDLGSWLMFFNQTRLTNKSGLSAEVQYRSFEVVPNTEQLLLRGGLNYFISNNVSASVGYGHISNYLFDKERVPGISVSENRLWQQVLLRGNYGRVLFEHRYRFEQRWLASKSTDKYLDRIRYLFRVTVPLNKEQLEKKTFFLAFYNEVFIHFTTTPFDRNRLFGALGYRLTPTVDLQLGYLAQTVNITTKHYLQAAFFYNIDLRKKEQ